MTDRTQADDGGEAMRSAEGGERCLPSDQPPAPPTRRGLAWRAGGVLRTLRPHQWVKNVFVLAPVVFARDVFDASGRLQVDSVLRGLGAFVVFCFLAGAVYTMNDMADLEADRQHPVKRNRPIPSGRVPLEVARAVVVALVIGSLGFAAWLDPWLALVAAAYFANNLVYSFRGKHVPYLDVSAIAAGFVLRVVAGGVAVGEQISVYLVACTALLAFFLGFGKRRHELTVARDNASRQRAALEGYTKGGLDLALTLTALATVGTYLTYTLDPATRRFFSSDWLWPSTLLVVAGIGRFLQLVRGRPEAESPTQEMLTDGPFVMIVLLWVGLVLSVVYKLQPGGG